MTHIFDERLRTLAQLRKLRSQYRERRDDLLDGLHYSVDWLENESKMKAVETEIFETEGEIKDEARNYYLTVGEKNPHAGVKVKVFTRLDIDTDYAKMYCLENLPDALIVQNKVLEKVLKALPKLPDWAVEFTEARAQISTDLGKVFGALEEAEDRPMEELETAERIIDQEEHGVMVVELKEDQRSEMETDIECPRCKKTLSSYEFSGDSDLCSVCKSEETLGLRVDTDDIPF